MKLLHLLLRLHCNIAVIIAGAAACSPQSTTGGGSPLYGMQRTDPTVVLLDSSYAPPSPWRIGSEVSASATLNHAPGPGYLPELWLYVAAQPVLQLRDDGVPPDTVQHDGAWHGRRTLAPGDPLGPDLPVRVRLTWGDFTSAQELSAPPLTILPPEEGI